MKAGKDCVGCSGMELVYLLTHCRTLIKILDSSQEPFTCHIGYFIKWTRNVVKAAEGFSESKTTTLTAHRVRNLRIKYMLTNAQNLKD